MMVVDYLTTFLLGEILASRLAWIGDVYIVLIYLLSVPHESACTPYAHTVTHQEVSSFSAFLS